MTFKGKHSEFKNENPGPNYYTLTTRQ